MITSNININILNTLSQNNNNTYTDTFKNNLLNSLENKEEKDNSFTYSNIKGMSLEEIEDLYTNDEDKQMAKNLRLTTLFSNDDILGQALFNTVQGQPFELSYTFLYDRYEDKHSYLSTNVSFEDLLHSSIVLKKDNDNKKVTDQISDNKLNEILTAVKSFDFLDTLLKTTKDKRDEKDDYSYLYNDYHMMYEELKYKYDDIKAENESYLSAFLKN